MSDLISREEVKSVLHNNLHALIDTDQLYQLYKDINRLPTYSIPSADIMECAREIKDYCEKERINCAKCPFYNRDRLLSCNLEDPCMSWNLPEGEKGGE